MEYLAGPAAPAGYKAYYNPVAVRVPHDRVQLACTFFSIRFSPNMTVKAGLYIAPRVIKLS